MYQWSVNKVEGAGRSLSSWPFSRITGTRRHYTEIPPQRLFETAVTWENFETCSRKLANSEPETSTSDHAEAFEDWKTVNNTKVLK